MKRTIIAAWRHANEAAKGASQVANHPVINYSKITFAIAYWRHSVFTRKNVPSFFSQRFLLLLLNSLFFLMPWEPSRHVTSWAWMPGVCCNAHPGTIRKNDLPYGFMNWYIFYLKLFLSRDLLLFRVALDVVVVFSTASHYVSIHHLLSSA
jgi:hypothetical protein